MHAEQSRTTSIPLDRIRILNPRARNRRKHQEIVESIGAVGLKRPITVSRRGDVNGVETFDLVCGQGRLEAVRMLGYAEIPAYVVEGSEQDCMVMSLVENVARRNHSAPELLREIDALRSAGYSDSEIATKVGLSVAYLQDVLMLMEHGEERLLAAVDNGTIPIALAIQISRATDTEVQRALAEAYAAGALKGQQITIVRRLIQRRALTGNAIPKHGTSSTESQALTPERLRKMYIKAGEKQRLLVKKAELVDIRLNFLVEALRDLLGNPDFVETLRSEGFSTLPHALQQRIFREAT
ncbi:plasmid partitioning protein RepB C-terminal domain-containing protein [Paraburkholderia aspalathi]|uniref:plasmid partitioning protein RepB C-terminal domain-containing protein n=1 Tax=Paraburkholderia aspalathi TaxID=1324617 RepID=UPI0038BBACA4